MRKAKSLVPLHSIDTVLLDCLNGGLKVVRWKWDSNDM